MSWKKQLRTTIFLLILIAACVDAVLYMRLNNTQPVQQAEDADLVMIEVNNALTRYENHGSDEFSTLRTIANADMPQKADVLFCGLGDEALIRSLLTDLKDNAVNASFYVTGSEAVSSAKSLSMIVDAGYAIGTFYTGDINSKNSAASRYAVSDFIRTGAAIQTIVGVRPSNVLVLEQPDDELLAAAYASYMMDVYVPTHTITLADIETPKQAQEFAAELPRQSLLCIRLNQTDSGAQEKLSALCKALGASDLNAHAEMLISQNADAIEPISRIYTTERSVAFTFSGLGNNAELTGVLDALSDVNGTGTFFVTRDELTRYPDEIRRILAAGHELGISVQPNQFEGATMLLVEILKTQEEIKMYFDYSDVLAVRPSYGTATESLKAACGAGGFTLTGAMVNVVRTEDIRQTDASLILDTLLPANRGVLQRGELVHFQMKQYHLDDNLLGELIRLIDSQHNIYTIRPVMKLAQNTEATYTYPLPAEEILPEVRDAIYPGQLTGNPMTAIAARYIGIGWVSSSDYLPGFTSSEIKQLDNTGLIPNQSNMVFLSFDDWGFDQTITKLLDVLKAHNAKATFFVYTENVLHNPNLLRAIAAEGHTIGCHTHTHFPISNSEDDGKRYAELTDEQVNELKKDLVASYGVLQSIVGDIKIGNKPALSRLFRPPTLAVGKAGLTAVFDCGFTYSVSGSYTSHDYEASNASKLASDFQRNTKSGAVIVMHMSNTSIYTAEALHMYLSEMEQKYPEKPYRFVALSEKLD